MLRGIWRGHEADPRLVLASCLGEGVVDLTFGLGRPVPQVQRRARFFGAGLPRDIGSGG